DQNDTKLGSAGGDVRVGVYERCGMLHVNDPNGPVNPLPSPFVHRPKPQKHKDPAPIPNHLPLFLRTLVRRRPHRKLRSHRVGTIIQKPLLNFSLMWLFFGTKTQLFDGFQEPRDSPVSSAVVAACDDGGGGSS
ncbi:hypothetical protein PIB30_068140, partial [Stylosanthes scabra]|nr:hypothetical protein [Stylosanthes scabra]